MKYLLLVQLMLFAMLFKPVAAETLDQLQAEALANNAKVQASHAGWQAMEEKKLQLGWWPNPKLKYSFLNLPSGQWDFTQTPMSGKQLMIMQKMPLWKAPLRGSMGQAVAQAYYEQWQTEQWDVKYKIAKVFYQLLYLREADRILQKNQQLVSRLVKVARVKYEGGRGLEQDVLRAGVELALLDHQLLEIKEQWKVAQNTLAGLLSRKQNDPILLEGQIQWQPRVLDRKVIIGQALANNPTEKKLLQQTKSAVLERRIADTGWIPDLEVSGYYTWREEVPGDPTRGKDFVGVAAGIEIPLWFFRQDVPAAREAKDRVTEIKERRQAWQDQLGAKVNSSLDRLERLAASQQLYNKRVLPQARAALASSMTAYQTGRVDFLTVINNETMLVKHEIKYQKIMAEYEQEIAYLESLTGNTLNTAVQEEEQ